MYTKEQPTVKFQYTKRNIEFFVTYHGVKVIVHTARLEGLDMDMGDLQAYVKQHRELAILEAATVINACRAARAA